MPRRGAELAQLAARVERVALTPDEAAASLGVSRDTRDRHIANELRWIRRGRRKLVPVAEVRRWADETAARPLGK